jgi:taurine dioxygenase
MPALGSILVARDVTVDGGDILFAGMHAGWDPLSDGLKRTLEGLRAVHSSLHVFGAQAGYHGTDLRGRLRNPDAATQDAVHPAVIRHPETGHKPVCFNCNFTLGFEGWTREESNSPLTCL